MTLSLKELKSGVSYWRDTNWPQDFHNQFYQDIADSIEKYMPHADFNEEWWEWFIAVLHGWRANRPKSQKYLTNRMFERSSALTAAWKDCIVPNIKKDIAQIKWKEINRFPDKVKEIKNVDSPVFTSKFCHFLAPHIFPVVDNAAMGNPFPDYQSYYECGQCEWNSTEISIQKDMEEFLSKEIGKSIYASYPIKCKIIELCLTGRHNT